MLPLVIAGAAAIAGGIGNYLANKSAQERAEMLQDKALQEWIKISIPDPKEQQLALQQFVVTGRLAPQMEKAIQADPSAFEKIVTDSTHKNAQTRALKELSDIGNQGGLRLQDKAALQEAQQDSIDKERGSRLALAQEFANRGQGGSGMAFAAQLQNQQGAADRNARSGLDIAAKAQDRAFQSIIGAGDMATKMRGQDFDEQKARASAQDAINLFNTRNMQDVQQRNIASQNEAAAKNLAEQQRISDQNVKQSNYQQEYNKNLIQQRYDNEMKRAAGMAPQYNQLAGTAIKQGETLGNLYSNMASGISGSATAYGNQQNAQANQASNQQFQMDLLDKYFKNQKQQQS